MPRISLRHWKITSSLLVILVAAVALTSCGGGGGGSGVVGLLVLDTSFPGFPAAPGGMLSPIFRDEVLLVTFNQSIDTGLFGGFVLDGTGAPIQFLGFSSGTAQGVPYFAYANQAAASVAFQIVNDQTSVAHGGIVGVSVIDPRVLVFDPKVPFGNVLGLPGTQGFDANTQYDVFIPANGGLTAGGMAVPPFGGLPPQNVPPFNPSPPPSTIFQAGPGFAPDTIPPQVVDISSPNADPVTGEIPHDAQIDITFSESIDPTTINRQANLLIRNLSVTTTTSPTGVLVPVVQTSNASDTVFSFTPVGSFGNGPFDIQVSVLGQGNIADADAIKDLPSGASGTQNSLGNTLIVTFRTQTTTGQQTSATISEDFSTDMMGNTREDMTNFTPRYNPAEWNQPVPPSTTPSGQLRGVPIAGVATQGPGGLGQGRMQFTFTPNGGIPAGPPTPPCTTPTCFYFSPFDDNCPNGAGCPPMSGNNTPQSQNGGSHYQGLYLTNNIEFPAGFANSIELVEWASPPATGAFPFVFGGFTMNMGHTSSGITLGMEQLVLNFVTNWTFDNPQNEFINPPFHPDPANMNLNETPIQVVPPQPYNTAAFTVTGFIPFPVLNLAFDYDDNRMEPDQVSMTLVNPNLLLDIRIPQPVGFNGNVIVGSNAAAATPIRRVFGGPDSAAGFSSDMVIYHLRYTTVDKNSSARSVFFDLGMMATNPDYINLDLFPDLALRPPGTSIVIRLQGADSLTAGEPSSGDTGIRTYVARDGTVMQSGLDALDGHRFFRVTFEFESNLANNASVFLDGFLLGFTL